MLEQLADVDAIVVPVGGGSGAAGACIVGEGRGADVEVIGVQSDAAPAAYARGRSAALRRGPRWTRSPRASQRGPRSSCRSGSSGSFSTTSCSSSEDDIRRATVAMIEGTRNLVEPAGASPLAAAIELAPRLAGKRVVLICSGGNVTLAQLRELLG